MSKLAYSITADQAMISTLRREYDSLRKSTGLDDDDVIMATVPAPRSTTPVESEAEE